MLLFADIINELPETTNASRDQSIRAFAGLVVRWSGILSGAALITLALFLIMQMLIAVEDVTDIQQPEHTLHAYMLPLNEDDERVAIKKPRRMDVAQLPPPPPKLSESFTQLEYVPLSFNGAIPKEPVADQSLDIIPKSIALIQDRRLKPISPPIAKYPMRARLQEIEGECKVRFDVSASGRPINVKAACTNSVFIKSAESAIRTSVFAPQISENTPVVFRNAVYPMEFSLE